MAPYRLHILMLTLSAAFGAASCSFVDFETSPYAPRALQAVYSEHDDLTYLVWRIADVADPELLSYELWQDGELRPIELSEAPIPAAPFTCDRLYLCLQYQLPGVWSPPSSGTALRATHKRFGLIPSAPVRPQQVAASFDIAPVATANNRFADAGLTDLLKTINLPHRRSFEWVLFDAPPGEDAAPCPSPPTEGWQALRDRVELPQSWTDNPPCMGVRPRRTDQPAHHKVARLDPGPVLHVAELDHSIEAIRHPTHIAFLVDLQVTNAGRCQQIVDAVRQTILSEFAEEHIPVRELGMYYPRDRQGMPTSGCDQSTSIDYPVNDILAEGRNAMADEVERSALTLVVINNLQLNATPEKVAQLRAFNEASELPDAPYSFGWLVGSEVSYPGITWSWNTPWQALESRDFEPPLRSAVRYIFPLTSTPPLENYELELPLPPGSQTPRYLKLCQLLPIPTTYIAGQREYPVNAPQLEWPAGALPRLRYALTTSEFSYSGDFHGGSLEVVYEVCDAFCQNAFRGRNGLVYSSWLNTPNACQWGGR
ncbi:hypothetical protein DV096_04615 [Bradymonadaceae bacterium TMQ3]|uniref:Uncharacterized protein n=1 Tax=Lujinxingia sediminis TaxID=2480984 RepID=A0ABY0CXF8_9DELT|nr:hypothetical protein [Lujinxingia sediminis]RDV39851.1 hypothetical protein DV096_04615 [Bradymonadaceae bacterium TMQ3]RVU48105.1 hypothetical protein EA187_01315 [Lujinxingia sediminis]TXC77404.1 hypothetical protein FRC91_01320 [Bradymonadales bacterium TMQ1]